MFILTQMWQKEANRKDSSPWTSQLAHGLMVTVPEVSTGHIMLPYIATTMKNNMYRYTLAQNGC